MERFETVIDGAYAHVYTPYNRDFVARIKNASGRWNAQLKCWDVPVNAVNDVRSIMLEVYGRDDLNAGELLTVVLRFSDECNERCGDYVLLGKVLSRAKDRDSGARAGTDVVYIEGKPMSGGSRLNWRSVVPTDSVVKLLNVQRSLVDAFRPPYGVTVEILNEDQPIDRDALTAEREKLLSRVSTINALLGE